ncbi:hypothetical protein [Nucisporomicrobium flavum]|uniref:hypothetical protein n=1 Tax=Nucisporomicrobium flavum TaxID=2785915 RepID=UPI0018F4C110|nr:hypothetical protein [Nucisporomicrobium flavum]
MADDLDLPESEMPIDPAHQISTGSPNTGPVVEPNYRAVNGFLRVRRFGGAVTEHYVAHQPDFIAERLMEAKEAGQAIFRYWDMPGRRDAKLIEFATATVESVSVVHLEADLEALWDDSTWAL